ncbi:hypothetical protein [uncultured Amphritea sp.]|uniref:hypothetical protein n=1 Tax=uncultured Amphritea sp. TaxID=981605 RepID=UPI002603B198|nr:hypothetical protein [uncultured Amphritea sp.]
MSYALNKKILDLVADEPKTADEIMAVIGNEVGPKAFNSRIKSLINCGYLSRIDESGAPIKFVAASLTGEAVLTEEEALYEIPTFVATKASALEDEIAMLNQGIAAAEVLSKRSLPDDLADVISQLDSLAVGISENAPVAAAVLIKARDYLQRGYEL